MFEHEGITPPTEKYPPLPHSDPRGAGRRLRICIASPDFVGPVKNGGVGTAFTALGEALAAAGHQVTLLFLGGQFCENLTLEHWIEYYRKQNIRFVPLPGVASISPEVPFPMRNSYEAYLWLKKQPFDIIHFSEWRGPGYYSLLAKRQGLAFQKTILAVQTHGPSFWHSLSNGEYITQAEQLELDAMEQETVRLADVVVSPSHYLLEWMKARKWQLPPVCYVQQYVMPRNARRPARPEAQQAAQPVREIVFFGRIEERKGIVLFCDALDLLAADGLAADGLAADGLAAGRPAQDDLAADGLAAGRPAPGLRVTILGKRATVRGQEAVAYLEQRAAKWPWPWQVISDRDQTGAITYLQGEGRLAVMPSLADNLPNTVLECLGAGIPFLASNAGGIPEMILDEDVERVCFPLRPAALAAKLRAALLEGVRPARLAFQVEENERAWVAWHNALPGGLPLAAPAPAPVTERPWVSVIIPHFNRPEALNRALKSLQEQTYKNYEVIVVDDGSTDPQARQNLSRLEAKFALKGWKVLYQENRYPGAARNTGARQARGEYLLFMDDDNLAEPHEIATLVKAAQHSGADILTCHAVLFQGDPQADQRAGQTHLHLFLGGAPAASLMNNRFGDMNALVRKQAFEELGGFTEDYGVGYEDWELFAKAALRGLRVEVVPEPLYWYKVHSDGVNNTTPLQANSMRMIRPYLEAVPDALRDLILFAQGAHLRQYEMQGQLEAAQKESERSRALVPYRARIEAAKVLAQLELAQVGQAQVGQAQVGPVADDLVQANLQAALQTRDPHILLEVYAYSGFYFAEVGQAGLAREMLLPARQWATTMHQSELKAQIDAALAGLAPFAPSPQEILAQLLEAQDIVTALQEQEEQFTPELLELVQANAHSCHADGEPDLAEGFEQLAAYIEGVLALKTR